MLKNEHTYQIDLRSPELLLLQRAIKMYIQNYTTTKSLASAAWEKEEAQSYIDAACNLSNRLTYDIKENV